jgi:hypothetical protein
MCNRLLFHLHPIFSLQLRPQVNLLLNKRKEEADPANGNRNLPNQLQCIRISLHNLISGSSWNEEINFLLACEYAFPLTNKALAIGSVVLYASLSN